MLPCPHFMDGPSISKNPFGGQQKSGANEPDMTSMFACKYRDGVPTSIQYESLKTAPIRASFSINQG